VRLWTGCRAIGATATKQEEPAARCVDRQTQYGQHETASCLEPLYSSPCSAGVHFGPASPCTWAMFFGSPKAGRSPPVLRCRLTNSGGTQVTDQRRRSRDTALSLAGRNRGANELNSRLTAAVHGFPSSASAHLPCRAEAAVIVSPVTTDVPYTGRGSGRILPRSLLRPRASTEGRLTENLNKTGVRLWA
jgi:hypothetical protein